MNKLTKVAGAAAAATLVAISGSAFTGGLTGMPTAAATVGYGATQVDGAILNRLTYTFSADRTQITGVTFQLEGDTVSETVELLANGAVKDICDGLLNATGDTDYTCSPLTIDAKTLTETAISVTGGLNKTV